jgi:tRNA acetyltransferase TAN1
MHSGASAPSRSGDTMDLLVSYECGRFGRAKREIHAALGRCGDELAAVERSAVNGIVVVHTELDARAVVRCCRELSQQGFVFRFAIKWVPVDYWCPTDLEAIRKVLADQVRGRIAANETWGMKLEKRGWLDQHTQEIVVDLARAIDRKVNLSRPDRIVHIDMLGSRTAISVLGPGDLFSVTASGERHAADGDA